MELEQAIEQLKEQVVAKATEIVHENIQRHLMDGEQLSSPDQEGSAIEAAFRLEDSTIRHKRSAAKHGLANPAWIDLPRMRSGQLYDSINAIDGMVFTTDPRAYEQQTGVASNGIRPSAPRPFFGVSDRAVGEITDWWNKNQNRLYELTQGASLPDVEMTV